MWRIIGQQHAVKQLQISLEQNRMSHAYLLVGPPRTGKVTLALNIAQAVNCPTNQPRPCGDCPQCMRIAALTHADVRIIGLQQEKGAGESRKEIGIDDIREMQHKANLKPYEGVCRVFIFDNADSMSEEAANALLKTLEEPPPQTLLILLTSQEDRILPTIRSRVRRIEIKTMPHDDVANHLITNCSVEVNKAEILARLSRGRIGWALAALEDATILEHRKTELERIANLMNADMEHRFQAASDLASLFYSSRNEAQALLQMWLEWWRDLLMVREGTEETLYNVDCVDILKNCASNYTSKRIIGFIHAIVDTINALDHNVNARLCLEAMMLAMPSKESIPQGSKPP